MAEADQISKACLHASKKIKNHAWVKPRRHMSLSVNIIILQKVVEVEKKALALKARQAEAHEEDRKKKVERT